MGTIRRFMRAETAATAIEYALVAGFISILIVTAVTATGRKLSNKFTKISNALT